jgi:hypothetical protein
VLKKAFDDLIEKLFTRKIKDEAETKRMIMILKVSSMWKKQGVNKRAKIHVISDFFFNCYKLFISNY